MSNLLSEVHPELVLEWSERNLPLTPDKITYGSNKIVWWIGTCGHEWQTSVKARSSGEKCPICSGARAVEGINDLVTLKPELAAEWSSKNNPLKPTMVTVGSHKKVIWKGKCGHEWTATVKSRAISGTGCPYCSHNKVLEGFNDLASQRPLIASEWSERNYPLKPNMVTVFANRKVWWKCSKGHEWNTLISTRSGGSQCPYCSGQILLKGFNDFATTHPQLAQEWSDRNLPLTPDMINEKSRKNVWWKCRECGYEWQSVVYARIRGTVCPVCADRTVMTGYNDLATTDAHLLSEWDYEKNKDISPNKVSRNSMRSVWWKCSLGHSWKAKENQLILARAFPTQQKNTCKVIIGRKEYWVRFSNLLFAERKWLSDITIYQGRCSYGNISKIYSCYNNWKEQIKKQAREKAIRKREEKIALRKARKERLERERLALYDGKKKDDIRVPSYLSNYARHPFQGGAMCPR